jgi:hypothetical protein
LDKVAVWAQIHKLPDNFLKVQVVKGMCRGVGEVEEVQITLPAGFVGSFIRVKVKIDVIKKLSRFVSITKKGVKDFYQVKYEKLPIFCFNCGIIGHLYEECGTGEFDVPKLEWGNFILADGGRGRGHGRFPDRGRGGRGRDQGPWGRGRGGRTANTSVGDGSGNPDTGNYPTDMDYEGYYLHNPFIRKRLAVDCAVTQGLNKEGVETDTVSLGNALVAGIVEHFEGEKQPVAATTPQKQLNKKKARVDGTDLEDGSSNLGSAASFEEDRREQ